MKDPIFKTNPKLEHYFKTADGNAFFTEHDAKNHATSLKSKKVEKVERPFVKEKAKATPPVDTEGAKKNKKTPAKKDKGDKGTEKDLTPMAKAKLRIVAIEKMQTVADVEGALKGETASTVIKAGESKIRVLNAATTTGTSTNEEE